MESGGMSQSLVTGSVASQMIKNKGRCAVGLVHLLFNVLFVTIIDCIVMVNNCCEFLFTDCSYDELVFAIKGT